MEREKIVFVKSRLSQGGFPSECLFHIDLPGSVLSGVAPLHYCYSRTDRRQLQTEIPPGKEIEGLVIGVKVGLPTDEGVRVHLPNGELYEVGADQIIPTGVFSRVPVQ